MIRRARGDSGVYVTSPARAVTTLGGGANDRLTQRDRGAIDYGLAFHAVAHRSACIGGNASVAIQGRAELLIDCPGDRRDGVEQAPINGDGAADVLERAARGREG